MSRQQNNYPSEGTRHQQITVNVNQQSPQTQETYGTHAAVATEPTFLESLYRGGFEPEAKRELEQFGYAYFNTDTTQPQGYAGPVPGNYILGPADEVLITLSGGLDAQYREKVDREGLLHLPEFGTLAVSGTRFDALAAKLERFIAQTRRGFELTVTMGQLRTITVNVVGQVEQPGPVTISALGSVVDALQAAGGPRPEGSLRNIRLKSTDTVSTSTAFWLEK